MGTSKLNCLVMLGTYAIRADRVIAVKTGPTRNVVVMDDGVEWWTDMSIKDAMVAINSALTTARAALKEERGQ